MTQPLFPSTIGAQSRSVKVLTIKLWSEKRRSDRVPVLGQGGASAKGGGDIRSATVGANLVHVRKRRLCSRILTAKGTRQHAKWTSSASKSVLNVLRQPQGSIFLCRDMAYCHSEGVV